VTRWILLLAAALTSPLALGDTLPDDGVLTLAGDTHYVALDRPSLQITSSPITVQAWFRTTDPDGVIFECGAQNRDPGPQAGYALLMKWGRARFGVSNSVEKYKPSLWDDATSAKTYNDGKWHHASGVFHADGENRVDLYVDGVCETDPRRVGEAQPALAAYTQTKPVARIGSWTDRITYPMLNQFFWNGELDEIRVWNRALSPQEIKANWNRSVDPAAQGLVACWKFDKPPSALGDAVRDAAHDNHGVLAEFTYVPAAIDPFFPIDRIAFPEDDFDYSKYPAAITGYTGQNMQRIGFVTWEKARRRRVGPRGNYKAGFTQLPDGKLVLAACRRDAGPNAAATFYDMYVYESSDLGDTWKRINETPLIGKEPALAALPDGTLILTAQNLDRRPDAPKRRMNAYRSTDGGRTWGEIVIDDEEEEEEEESYAYPRNIFVEEDGTLIYLRDDGIDMTLCRSVDGGQTWTFTNGKVEWAPKDMNPGGVFAEIGVIRKRRSGRLLAVIRREIPGHSGEGFHDTFLSESTDNGKTWSRPWRASGTAEVHGYLTELSDGRLLMTYASYHLPYGPAAVVSCDGGKTFDRENPIQLCVSADLSTGWPVTLQLGDGSLITSYATTIYAEKDPPTTACEVVRWQLPGGTLTPALSSPRHGGSSTRRVQSNRGERE